MQHETALLWWNLGILNARRYHALTGYFGSLDAALPKLTKTMLEELGLRSDSIERTFEMIRTFDQPQLEARMQHMGVQLVTLEDEQYPPILREIADPPVFLSYRGSLQALEGTLIAVVGTRRMSPYGRRVVETFVPPLVRNGVVTVSGLALGVDAAVAKDTLTHGGTTIAVLGHGLTAIHPAANRVLGEKIVEKGGLILSEYPLDQFPDVYTFPARNRIIAGVSRATLVIEAPEDSGSIITAELALEYNRDVFAVPGQIFDDHVRGSHRLIGEGRAKLVHNADDMLCEIGMERSDGSREILPAFVPGSDDERRVHNALTSMPQTIDDLVEELGMDAARIGAALTFMELAGAARTVGGGEWVR